MTRYERLKAMSIEQIAAEIIRIGMTDKYCKSDCVEANELECCIRWLNEKVAE